MSNTSIEAARAAKSEMEANILAEINTFERSTGLCVRDINPWIVRTVEGKSDVVGVNAEVDL